MSKMLEDVRFLNFQSLQKGKEKDYLKEKKEVLSQFEAFFIHILLKEMGRSFKISSSSFTHNLIFDLFLEKVSEFAAKKGLGIREEISRILREDL